VTEWLTFTQPAVGHESERKSCFFFCSIWPSWRVTSFLFQVLGRKFHTELFDSSFWGICWLWLHMSSGDRPVGRTSTASAKIELP